MWTVEAGGASAVQTDRTESKYWTWLYDYTLCRSFVVCISEWNRPHVFIYTPQKIKIMSDAALQMCDVIQQPSVRPHPVCPSSLQLPNQTRMESGPEVVSQSSSLLPISGFPMQVRTSSWKLQNQKWFCLWNVVSQTCWDVNPWCSDHRLNISSIFLSFWDMMP